MTVAELIAKPIGARRLKRIARNIKRTVRARGWNIKDVRLTQSVSEQLEQSGGRSPLFEAFARDSVAIRVDVWIGPASFATLGVYTRELLRVAHEAALSEIMAGDVDGFMLREVYTPPEPTVAPVPRSKASARRARS